MKIICKFIFILGFFGYILFKTYNLNADEININSTIETKEQNLKGVQVLQKEVLQEIEANYLKTELYVFASLSMSKPALLALNQEAAEIGATIVLRGLKDNSYQKTASYLQEIIAKTGQGFLIHPELFKRYDIHQVPTIVLTTKPLEQKPIFDIVSGHIPIKTALLKIVEQGELTSEAKDWLKRNSHAE